MAHRPGSEPPPIPAGAKGRCPRCGEGRMFDGYLTVRARCEACDLDYGFADAADGPAVFVMFIVGFLVVGLALWVEFAYTPPVWVHIALWFPLTAILSLAIIRPLKGVMIALQYHHRAEEGRLESE
ncbi:DUF983 domain-containing protein [Salinarimonas chemoclinalis]|uniref:DUF983 domain-containing protein n=1 Tax=Salinarimonas chemoclinalis TaxID=3241599 RepID=UPI0035565B5B